MKQHAAENFPTFIKLNINKSIADVPTAYFSCFLLRIVPFEILYMPGRRRHHCLRDVWLVPKNFTTSPLDMSIVIRWYASKEVSRCHFVAATAELTATSSNTQNHQRFKIGRMSVLCPSLFPTPFAHGSERATQPEWGRLPACRRF